MKLAALVALQALALTACVTDSNRCLSGYEYSSQYDTCLSLAGPDGGDDASEASASADDAGSTGEASANGEGGSTGLGNACNGNSDCTGQASYCLKSPIAAPTDPGICTIPHCTAAECTSAYACCTCTSATLASLQAYPPGICAPVADESQLTALGCSCL